MGGSAVKVRDDWLFVNQIPGGVMPDRGSALFWSDSLFYRNCIFPPGCEVRRVFQGL